MNSSVRFPHVLLFALTVGVASSPSPTFCDEGDDAYKVAAGLYEDESWTTAEEAFTKFLANYSDHPRSPLARLYLGQAQFQLKKYANASATLKDFVKRHGTSRDVPHAKHRIAECSYHLGKLEDAVKEFSDFTASYPKDPLNEWAWAYLGDAQRRLNQYDKAVISLGRSLELFPKGRMADEARFGLAQATQRQGKINEAIEIFREVAEDETSKRADSAQLQIGNLYFGQKKFDDAAKEYRKIAATFEKSDLVPTSQLNAGFSLYELGNYAEAMGEFDRAETGFQKQPDSKSKSITAGYWKGLSLKALQAYEDAADVLSDVAKNATGDPLAESVLYQLADCTFRSGDLKSAQERFLVVNNRWADGQYGDYSLYFATECALELASANSGDGRKRHLQEAELLLDKFERVYKKSRIRFSHDMQRGHFYVLRDQPNDLKKAEELYTSIIAGSKKSQTRGEARFELARLLKNKGDTRAALAMVAPLARAVMGDASLGFPESLILYSHLALAENDLSAARDAADSYLRANKSGVSRDQAWAYVALASSKAKDLQESERAIDKLLSEHADSPVVSRTIHSVAETAYDLKDWDGAIRFFMILAETGEESPFFPVAQSGLGWSHFNKKDFKQSQVHFRIVVEKAAKHESAPEAGFKIGECLLQSDMKAEAARAFEEAFAKFQPTRRAFLAGVQAARVYVDLGDVKSADTAYSNVEKAFSELDEHDLVLNEWALLLYEAEDFEKSDEIFARLAKEHPESAFADNARFSLAESNLVNGKEDEAAKEFSALAADKKADAEVQSDSLYRLVGIAASNEDWKSVVARTEELNERFENSPYKYEMLFELGRAQSSLAKFAEAEAALNSVLDARKQPEVAQADWYPHAWILLADAQVRQRQNPRKSTEALETAAKFREENPKSPLTYRIDEIAGRAYMRQAKFDEARAAFARVGKSSEGSRTPTAAKAQFMIGESYTTQKQHKKALEAYQSVYYVYTTLPEWQEPSLYQMAVCHQTLSDKTNAIKFFEKLLKEFPESEFKADVEKRLKQLQAN